MANHIVKSFMPCSKYRILLTSKNPKFSTHSKQSLQCVVKYRQNLEFLRRFCMKENQRKIIGAKYNLSISIIFPTILPPSKHLSKFKQCAMNLPPHQNSLATAVSEFYNLPPFNFFDSLLLNLSNETLNFCSDQIT